MESPEHERRSVTEYVELEADDETVTHAEKISSERLMGHEYDVWDVDTNKNRWWVITNPTNLYLQSEFKSMDYVRDRITFAYSWTSTDGSVSASKSA